MSNTTAMATDKMDTFKLKGLPKRRAHKILNSDFSIREKRVREINLDRHLSEPT